MLNMRVQMLQTLSIINVSEASATIIKDSNNLMVPDLGSAQATEEPNQDKQSIALKQDIQEQSPNPLELLTWSEKLSLRFKALDGNSDTIRAPNLRLRYAMEANIRVTDCKALLSHGGSLAPFWLHIQAQLSNLILFLVWKRLQCQLEQNNLGFCPLHFLPSEIELHRKLC